MNDNSGAGENEEFVDERRDKRVPVGAMHIHFRYDTSFLLQSSEMMCRFYLPPSLPLPHSVNLVDMAAFLLTSTALGG